VLTEEKSNFTERAVNKFIELILLRLVDAERLQVRIKSNFKKLGRGELDSLAIEMSGFLLRRNLRVAEFQFNIGASAVNIQSVMRRKIELLHPSEGKLRIAIEQEEMTTALNAELTDSLKDQQQEIQFQQVNCEFTTEQAIAFHFNWLCAEQMESGTYITKPQIELNNQGIVLIKTHFVGKEPATEFVNQAIALVSNILSLNDIANRGTSYNIEQIDLAAGKVIIQANANIEQFPSA